MNIQSPGFKDCERLPDKYSYVQKNLSPPLEWSDIPPGTVELAIICDDPDAPGKNWVHWVIWGIPASMKSLPEGVPKDEVLSRLGVAKQGWNDFGLIGYDGPAPPPGPVHRYFFKLYAVSANIILGRRANASDLRRAMEGKILAETNIMGTYKR